MTNIFTQYRGAQNQESFYRAAAMVTDAVKPVQAKVEQVDRYLAPKDENGDAVKMSGEIRAATFVAEVQKAKGSSLNILA
jgi:hypothetical protein